MGGLARAGGCHVISPGGHVLPVLLISPLFTLPADAVMVAVVVMGAVVGMGVMLVLIAKVVVIGVLVVVSGRLKWCCRW